MTMLNRDGSIPNMVFVEYSYLTGGCMVEHSLCGYIVDTGLRDDDLCPKCNLPLIYPEYASW